MRVKEESEISGLKLNIQKTKIMTSSAITSWQINEEKVERVTDFIFLGSKMTVDSDSNHKIKSCLLLGIKAMTNLDNVLNSRDITLPKKVHIVRAMVFPVVMYACDSWTIKKAEHRKIDAFELWCWRRLLTARRRRDSLDCKEIQPVHSEGDQPWDFFGRNDAKAETPVLWPPGAKS